MSILVTGGAGYIGSVAVEDLRLMDKNPVVIDNLIYGHRQALDKSVPFYEGDIGDKSLVRKIFENHDISACMHFSAFAYVGESVENPQKYFENNVVQTISFLDVLLEKNVKKFIFSSSCTIYGESEYLPIDEKHPQNPTNPYGWSKFMVEKVLESYDIAHNLKSVSLRYFNACGATEKHGEDHEPETHLIPLILQTAQGKRESISIYGDDYPTSDGTAIRDYIHVSDLSSAHILALEYLEKEGKSEFINLGNGKGYSVKEVLETAQRITKREISSKVVARRTGDPSELIADTAKAKNVLGWRPKYSKLEKIIESAWNWHQANPDGYLN